MADTRIAITVSCYAGYRGEETPEHFFIKERQIKITGVIDRWLAPDHRYFKVRADDAIYILRHDIATGLWELNFNDRNQKLPERNA